MRNRAKCRLCNSIIESFHETDYVECKCGEIAVNSGLAMKCSAKDFNNFLRVDDQGNEIKVKIKEENQGEKIEHTNKPSKEDLINMLDEMIKKIEELPQVAMSTPINHYDIYSLMILVSSLFKTKD